MLLNDLERRIVDLSYRHKLSHISCCLNIVNLIDDIYNKKKAEDIFVLGAGHASLAWYVVLEKNEFCDAEEMIVKHGVHASRDVEHGIHVSCGSLGQSEVVALGLAMANSSRTVWLATSDGSCMEGSVHEGMRIARHNCPNLKTTIVYNGRGAYGYIDARDLPYGPEIYDANEMRYPVWLRGMDGHYLVLTKTQRDELLA